MRVFGYQISITKSVPPYGVPQPTQPSSFRNWWWPVIREPYTGAWQRDVELRAESIITYFAVYSAITLIASDIGKLYLRLMQKGDDGLWEEVNVPAYSPVLRKPNHYQTRQKFIEQWMISKLIQGNTYVLKERDNRGVVVRLYVLDSNSTKVLVGPDGSVWYEVNVDNLSGVMEPVRIPASEIIHDVMVPLFHPLCGVSPLVAAALPVAQGMSIQRSSANLFAKGSRPSGIVTAPGPITEEQAEAFKHKWEHSFTGDNAGRVALVGDGMKYESLSIPAEDMQLIEQLKWSAENVASVFHVPPHMIGAAAAPAYDQNIEARTQQYYSQCLQTHIECIEALLDEGLGLAKEGQAQVYGTEFDLEDLLRMDTKTKVETTANGIRAGFISPNEARAKFNLGPTKGGESPIVQQQMFTLDGIAERDALLLAPKPAPAALPAPEPADAKDEPVNVDRVIALSRLYH